MGHRQVNPAQIEQQGYHFKVRKRDEIYGDEDLND